MLDGSSAEPGAMLGCADTPENSPDHGMQHLVGGTVRLIRPAWSQSAPSNSRGLFMGRLTTEPGGSLFGLQDATSLRLDGPRIVRGVRVADNASSFATIPACATSK